MSKLMIIMALFVFILLWNLPCLFMSLFMSLFMVCCLMSLYKTMHPAMVFMILMSRVYWYPGFKGVSEHMILYAFILLGAGACSLCVLPFQVSAVSGLSLASSPEAWQQVFLGEEIPQYPLDETLINSPSWTSSVGKLVIVDGTLSPPTTISSSEVAEWTYASPELVGQMTFASVEIEPMLKFLNQKSPLPFSPAVQDNMTNILNSWHSEPLVTFSKLLDNNAPMMTHLSNQLVSLQLFEENMVSFHLYSDYLVVTTLDHDSTLIKVVDMSGHPLWVEPMEHPEVSLSFTAHDVLVKVTLSNESSYKVLDVGESFSYSGEPALISNSFFNYEEEGLASGEWQMLPLQPPAGEDPGLHAFSRFFSSEVTEVNFMDVNTNQPLVMENFKEGLVRMEMSSQIFPTKEYFLVGRTYFVDEEMTNFVILAPNSMQVYSDGTTLVLIPVNKYLLSLDSLTYNMNWVWGPPLNYEGTFVDHPMKMDE